MEKQIKISVVGAQTVPWHQLTPLQGNLKDLSKENYERLKKEILDLGFSEPISIWQKVDDSNITHSYILNGTQRWRVVKTLAEVEGYQIPDLPVNLVEAADLTEAKKKILALASQYGTVTEQGLYEFLADLDVSIEDLKSSFVFPEINWGKFEENFFKDAGDVNALSQPGEVNMLDDGKTPESVRMVQLFFNEAEHGDFVTMMESLTARYQTTNLTDTVLKAIREVYGNNTAPTEVPA